jgi:uncharacterized membrane protein
MCSNHNIFPYAQKSILLEKRIFRIGLIVARWIEMGKTLPGNTIGVKTGTYVGMRSSKSTKDRMLKIASSM